MQQAQENLIAHLETHFLGGNLRMITPFFVYPLPMQCARTSEIEYASQDALSEALEGCRDALLARGVARLEPRVAATGIPRDGRASIWVDWLQYDEEAQHIGTHKVHYVMSLPEGVDVPQIERVTVTAAESDNL